MWNRFKTLDPWLYVVPVLLSAISVSYIYVLTVDSLGISLALRQGVFAVIGLFIMLAATFLDYRALKSWALWIFIAGMIGLVLVRLPFLGKSEFGAQLWIDFGFF
ncbi:MAG: Cell cycle protein, partial [Patescibacteria group bacterium]|nr:Cell cycle protein [Patescibacteria group bacterium]